MIELLVYGYREAGNVKPLFVLKCINSCFSYSLLSFSCLLDSCRRLGADKLKPKKLHCFSSKIKIQPGWRLPFAVNAMLNLSLNAGCQKPFYDSFIVLLLTLVYNFFHFLFLVSII